MQPPQLHISFNGQCRKPNSLLEIKADDELKTEPLLSPSVNTLQHYEANGHTAMIKTWRTETLKRRLLTNIKMVLLKY